ncbi:MAG: CHASE3 domain-containing protein [Hyphomicrobiales bacterium]|nr:CHASE3 domain-containing protein [Hyphomicrobiales bacterium]MCP5370408.1 CHASE3 domain-containing protein [Hyphomicrobiales bacterium]
MFASLNTKHKMLMGTGTQLLLTALLAIAALWGYVSIIETGRWVEHTREVLNKGDDIVLSAVNMETGYRGYLLAGKEEFLEPYDAGRKKLYEGIADLKKTVSDNPEQVERLHQVEQTMQQWQKLVAEPAIALRRSIGDAKSMNDIAALVKSGGSRVYFDQFQNQINTFVDRERKLLGERMITMEAARKNTLADTTGFGDALKWVIHTHEVIESAQAIDTLATDIITNERGYLLTGEESFLDRYKESVNDYFRAVANLQKKVSDNPVQVEQLEKVAQTLRGWLAKVAEPLIDLRQAITGSKTMDDMSDMVGEKKGKVYFDAMRDQMAEFLSVEERLMAVRQADAESTSDMVKSLVVASAIIAVAIGFVLAWVFARTADALRQVANNNVEISNRVSTTLSELTQAITSQSSGAEQQSTSVNETTATIDEIKATSQQTLEKARDLSDAAEKISDQGRQGVEAIRETIAAMNEIRDKVEAIAETNLSLSDQTKKIGEITAVVNAMSQESKMLALNASIEAAKAGEAGKGFAVVAGEVRKLAEQSEESTVQVQKILEEIQHATDRAVMATEEGTKQVDAGVRLVRQTGETVESLSDVIQRTADAGQQIVAAVRQEAVGIEQISTAMTEINGVTAQFVTSTSQSRQATETLGQVVAELSSSVTAMRI